MLYMCKYFQKVYSLTLMSQFYKGGYSQVQRIIDLTFPHGTYVKKHCLKVIRYRVLGRMISIFKIKKELREQHKLDCFTKQIGKEASPASIKNNSPFKN